MKLVNLGIYAVSFLCFLLALIAGDSVVAALGAIPFLLLVCAAVHEAGHCTACLLTGSTIREVRLPLLQFKEKHLCISGDLLPNSYCSFHKNRSPWLVYLLGPVFSLVFWCIILVIFLCFPSRMLLFGSILAFLVLLVNVIPYRNNDMAELLRQFRHTGERNP